MINRFRWVECQLETLRRCRDIEDVESALNGLPKDLDATYERIPNNITDPKDRKRAQNVLRILAVACRPLTIDEMNAVLMVDCENGNINPKRKMRDSFAILDICSSLIELSEYHFRLVHTF